LIILRIKERARHRISEWFAAANMLGFGMSLLAPGDTFSSASYQAFRQMLPYEPFGLTPEQQWGFLIATTGFLWLIGLIINGSRQRATMHIRASCGLVGGVVYGTLSLGFFLPYGAFLWSLGFLDAIRFILGIYEPPNAVYLSTGVWNYFCISMLCFYSIHAGLTEPVHEHGRSRKGG